MLMTLMPNWQTIKSLLQAYAQADGQVLFRETKLSVATQAAVPYVNVATQAVGDAVVSAPESAQDFAAVLVGAGRFVSFSLTGLVDFFGPIAEETPFESLQRMTKTVLNGTFALTTRAARFGCDGVPGNSRYEKGVAATEFGLSVLAMWGAAESLAARPPTATAKPLSLMPEFVLANAARAYVPAAGLVIEWPKLPSHILMMAGRPGVSDARLVEVLTKHGGNQTHAAQELGMDSSSISERIRRAPEGSPLKEFRNKWVRDADLLAALQAADGSQKLAAEKLGIDPGIVSGRVTRAADDSPLAAYRRKEVDANQVYSALYRHDGNQSAVARELGLGVSTVNRYAQQLSRVKPHTISDFDMMMGLRQYYYNLVDTARYLQVWPKDIIARIRDEESILSLVLRVTDDKRIERIIHLESGAVVINRNGGRMPTSPDIFRAVYLHCGSHVERVAEFLDVSRMSVYNAIDRWGLATEFPIRSRRANGSGPHAISGGERPPWVSLDELAFLYVEHRYNWRAVADAIGRSASGIFARIHHALVSQSESVLRFLIEVQRHIVESTAITDKHIAAIIIAHRFDLKRTAAFLSMTPEEVVARVRAFDPVVSADLLKQKPQ